jgi:hypothetical protein
MAKARQHNYYEVLDVKPDAAPIDIDRAYQKALALYSQGNPETQSAFTSSELDELSKMVEEAYGVLHDSMKRKDYDEGRSRDHVMSKLGEVVSVTEDYVTRRRVDKPALSTPEGMGRTAFSTYKIDKEIEDEIVACESVDGPFINKIRMYKGVTLEKMAEATRVSRTYLTALEHNNYKELPAPVFVRGYVVHVAKILGLDAEKSASSYMKRLREKLV